MSLLKMMKDRYLGKEIDSIQYFRVLGKMTQKEQNNTMRDYQEWKTTYDKENNLKALGRKRSGN